ncbi:5,6-dimethylbenzimidazole synthase [Shewanella gelidii]|uniref:Nitroreductase n=1 Tax=Shewanella gelidii TaxID=1642821 RepID=A0A917JTL9_9GAMM|nr:5,6-dimethylbenzimidazole synthase [Shewanella gelidii]MCL1098649.1 5,6-dimethylbenzimidazole synthase [Shewanella gelidii]GGI86354.1 nitroreductase [Shewanella gelidii]
MNNRQFDVQEQQLLEEIMLHRRDVRGNKFLSKPIEEEVLNKILHAATLAPSVGFSQPWEFVVIRDGDIKQQVADNFAKENDKALQLFHGEQKALYTRLKLEGIKESPVNIAVFYAQADEVTLGQTSMAEMGEYSVVCAIQNMWLMARSLNVGIGWVSIVDPQAVKQTLNAPAGHKLVGYLCVGYVDEFFDMPELEKLKWKQRKTLAESVHQNSY